MSTTAQSPPATLAVLGVMLVAGLVTAQSDDDGIAFFERRIRPSLVERCEECHRSDLEPPKGGLSLDSRAGWMAASAIVPGDPDASRLIRAVRYTDTDLQMPPKGRLSPQEVAWLEEWVRRGAPDPRDAPPVAGQPRGIDWDAAREHWAFKPMPHPAPPPVADGAWPRDPLDRFVLDRLEREGLRPAPDADRRTLIRRATFDLTGLPPSTEDIDAFLSDTREDAFAHVVDRLLASPRYGERWGRLWLDLARYADSNGVDENLAFGNAWRYRDYVIRSLNEDKPYDVFITEQLAGDLLPEPHKPDGTVDRERLFDQWTATGFLVLGPKMLAEQDKEKLVMDVVDEQMDVASRAIVGLTMGCARCHDHKFDPIPTEDYYALAGVFKSTSTMSDLGHVSQWRERPLATKDEVAARAAWETARAEAKKAQDAARLAADAAVAARLQRDVAAYLLATTDALDGSHLIEAEDAVSGNLNPDSSHWGDPLNVVVHTTKPGLQFAEYSIQVVRPGRHRFSGRYASNEPRPMRILVGGVLVDGSVLGGVTGSFKADGLRWTPVTSLELDAGPVVIRLEREGAIPHLDKFLLEPESPVDAARTRSEAPLNAAALRNWATAVAGARRHRDPFLTLWQRFAELPADGFAPAAAALVATLRTEHREGRFPLSPTLQGVLDAPPPASLSDLAARYQAVCSVVAGAWDRRAPKTKALVDPAMEEVRRRLLAPGGILELDAREARDLCPDTLREALAAAESAVAEIERRDPGVFPTVMAVVDGKPGDIPVHVRGSHLTLGAQPIRRGFPRIVDAVVKAPPVSESSSGRLSWARRLAQPEHPLTARVLVNRVWQGHFAQGLVRTPSNFGLRGASPSHPDLLDWLARSFVADGWSMKSLHRRIMLSRTYGMDSAMDPAAIARDPDNRLLWRQNRRRLEAELVRDAILAVSGSLQTEMGGTLLPTPNRGYVTNDQSGNQAGYDARRRAVYLPLIRNAMYDVFTTFDFNDPSVPVDQRPATVIPSQALFVLNSPLVIQESAAFARSLFSEGHRDPAVRHARAYRRAFGRPPTSVETARDLDWIASRQRALELATPSSRRGPLVDDDASAEFLAWQSFCQVLFASSEFLYVD